MIDLEFVNRSRDSVPGVLDLELTLCGYDRWVKRHTIMIHVFIHKMNVFINSYIYPCHTQFFNNHLAYHSNYAALMCRWIHVLWRKFAWHCPLMPMAYIIGPVMILTVYRGWMSSFSTRIIEMCMCHVQCCWCDAEVSTIVVGNNTCIGSQFKAFWSLWQPEQEP